MFSEVCALYVVYTKKESRKTCVVFVVIEKKVDEMSNLAKKIFTALVVLFSLIMNVFRYLSC